MPRVASAIAIFLVAFAVWLPTLGWGLPSRETDKYLFGDRRPWNGAEIIALTATTQPAGVRGADVDADPILDRSQPVVLNDTDAKRAAIVRRYRLMSGQPDEFIQFKALSEMAARPGLAKLDPRLYQYGGLWMYPVGALVRGAMLVGYIPTPPAGTAAMEFYLDYPEAFARFYVVARFYSWCWGLVAAFAIVWLARRITSSWMLSTLAAVAFMLTPVVRTATHEAKPHLAGAALCLCAVIAATRYVETGRRRYAIGAGALCGAAMAMVVSMLLSCVVLPTMVWLRYRAILKSDALSPAGANRVVDRIEQHREPAGPSPSMSAWDALRSLAVACVVTGCVYVATNPFVLYNAIANPDILRSNLGNSTAMYTPANAFIASLASAYRIAVAGMTWSILLLGFSAWISLSPRLREPAVAALSAVSGVVLLQFVLLAANKPAEYARFGLVPVAMLCITPMAFFARLTSDRQRKLAIGTVGLFACLELAFLVSSYDKYERLRSNRLIIETRRALSGGDTLRLGVYREPAAWSMPAFDLFQSTILLLPNGERGGADQVIWPANLAREFGRQSKSESLDWRENQFVVEVMPEAATRSGGEPRLDSDRAVRPVTQDHPPS